MGDLNMNALMVPLTLHGSVLVKYLLNVGKLKSRKIVCLVRLIYKNLKRCGDQADKLRAVKI